MDDFAFFDKRIPLDDEPHLVPFTDVLAGKYAHVGIIGDVVASHPTDFSEPDEWDDVAPPPQRDWLTVTIQDVSSLVVDYASADSGWEQNREYACLLSVSFSVLLLCQLHHD